MKYFRWGCFASPRPLCPGATGNCPCPLPVGYPIAKIFAYKCNRKCFKMLAPLACIWITQLSITSVMLTKRKVDLHGVSRTTASFICHRRYRSNRWTHHVRAFVWLTQFRARQSSLHDVSSGKPRESRECVCFRTFTGQLGQLGQQCLIMLLFIVIQTVTSRLIRYTYRLTGRAKKVGHGLMTIILSNLNRFKKKFTGRSLDKFVVKWIFTIPPHLACVVTLPCETLKSAKQAINDKLQRSVATYLRCGGFINNQIKKCLLLSLSENIF